PTRFQQVLVNLIGNGVKFTPAGGRVVVSATPHGDQAWITVQDSGVGIAKEELARIWDPFYQVEPPLRRRHGGSGLGLTIVRRLVELHGGVVRAESDGPGRGSRFTFTLPIAPAVAGEAEPEIEVAPEPVLAGRRLRCLPRQAVHAGEHGPDHLGDAQPPRSGGVTGVESARILVVEDNRDTSALLRDLLEAEGYHVESATTGEAAFDVLAGAPDF